MASKGEITVKISGKAFTLSKQMVETALRNVDPDPVRSHGVKIDGKVYPVKQVIAAVTKLDRLDFQSAQARSVLQRLDFPLWRSTS
jgi:hypothetical protein